MNKKTILLGITGSIAAYKACELVNNLKKKGFDIICIMTREAEKFITPLTLETLSGNKVYTDMFELPKKREIYHVSLAQKAALTVICPATANIISKLACGLCDDLLTCTIISSKSPVLIAPAMNDNMYKNKITQKNIAELKKAGYKFVDPVVGNLACGHKGVGHIADINYISKTINKLLS